MSALLSVLIILASVLLVLVVYVQNPKGGGLSSDFGSASQLGGVQKTNDFIEKTTWVLAGSIMVISILLTVTMPKTPEQIQQEQLQQQQEQQKQQQQNPAQGQQPAQPGKGR